MDKEHKEVAAQRYEMLVKHTLKGHTLEVSLVESVRANVDNIDFRLIEIMCRTPSCRWWDHWDERHEDWTSRPWTGKDQLGKDFDDA